MQFLKNNPKFVGLAAALVVVLGIWQLWLRGPAVQAIDSAEAAKRAAQSEMYQFSETGRASAEEIRQAEEALESLREETDAEERRVAFKSSQRFEVSGDNTAAQQLYDLLSRANKELSGKVLTRGIAWKLPDRNLGFPPGQVSEEVAREYLIRLEIVYRLIETITEQTPNTVFAIHEIQPVSDWGGGEGIVEDRYLNQLAVKVRFEAKGETTFKILHRVLSGNPKKGPEGQFMAIQGYSFERPDPNRDLLMVNLEVAAILVNPEGGLGVEE